MSHSSNKRIKLISFLAIFFGIAIIILISILSYNYVEDLSKKNENLYEDYETYRLFESINTNLTYFESYSRAYFITKNPDYLRDREKILNKIDSGLTQLQPFFIAKKNAFALDDYAASVRKTLVFLEDTLKNPLVINQLLPDQPNDKSKNVALMQEVFQKSARIKQLFDAEIDRDKKASVKLEHEYGNWDMANSMIALLIAILTGYFLLRNLNKRNKLTLELEQSKKEAEDAVIIKDQFMANMSHEIRTPLNAIVGFTGLLDKTETDPRRLDYIHTIKRSGENLLVIVNDILDFSKIQAGMLHLEKIGFSLRGLLNSVFVMFGQRAEEKKITLKLQVDERAPELLTGDPTRLTQILVNLIANAIKFTQAGWVEINVSCIERNEESVQLRFSIKDTGIGIEADKLDKIFERFNQGNAETTRVFGGTGLGLTIARSLIELQQGKLSVRSELNKGSEFYFDLNYKITHTPEVPAKKKSLQPFNVQKANVLVVEDNEMNQKLANEVLIGFGCDVTVAGNGEIAIRILKEHAFDLILMDIQMPVLDGYKTAGIIRNELNLQTPIVAMTAHIMTGEREKCLHFGMNDYLSKPFNENALLGMINKYVRKKLKTEYKNEMPATTDPDLEKINLNYLVQLSKGNKNFVRRMIEIYLDQNPKALQQLEQAIDLQDHQQIAAIVHSMKSSVSLVGLSGRVLADLELLEDSGIQPQSATVLNNTFTRIKATLLSSYEDIKLEIEKFV